MKRVYVASASKGSCEYLRLISSQIASEHFTFTPVLAFQGKEAPELRQPIMAVCLSVVREWAEVLVVIYEGVPTVGVWQEAELALSLNKPVGIYSPHADVSFNRQAKRFREYGRLREWLNGLK